MCTTSAEILNEHKVFIPEDHCDAPCHNCYTEVWLDETENEFGFTLKSFIQSQYPKYGVVNVDEASDDLIAKCEIPGIVVDPATGKVKVFVHRCKRHRDCLYCAGVRAGEFHKWIIDTMDRNEATAVVEVKLDNDAEYRKYRDKYGTDKVMRMPVHDGTVLLIVKEPELGDVLVTKTDLNNDYLQYISSTPERKRISGGWREKEEEVAGPTVRVAVRVLLSEDMPIEVARKIADETCKRTAHLRPTAVSLQDAVNTREDLFIVLAREEGYELATLAKEKWIEVPISRIHWR